MGKIRLTIIGAGPGGYVAALRAASLGAEVTLVDKGDLGGTCLNRGCIPTKTLRATAEAVETVSRAKSLGLDIEGLVRIDLGRLRARQSEVIGILTTGIERLLSAKGVKVVFGRAELVAPDLVRVVDDGGDTTEIAGDRIIIATGSAPTSIPGLDIDGRHVWSSDHALELTEIPGSLLVVGAGVVGSELAAIYRLLGSKVTLVEFFGRVLPLPAVDEDVSTIIGREMKKLKIKTILGATATGVKVLDDGGIAVELDASPSSGPRRFIGEIPVDRVLVSVGRGPNTIGLGLDRIGVATDGRGWIEVDSKLMTSVDGVYAIGDVLGPERIMLAHVAMAEAAVAAQNAVGAELEMDYSAAPWGVFTFPEAAGVGLSEWQAEEQGIDFKSDGFELRTLGRSQATGQLTGMVKLISDKKSGRILGAQIVGSHAAELIHEATLALRLGLGVSDLAETIHAHPTLAEGIMECAMSAAGLGLHAAD